MTVGCCKRLTCLGLLAVVGVGCSSMLVRPESGECQGADPGVWADRAAASIVVRPYRPGILYDLDRHGTPVRFRPGALDADAQAVISFPEIARFPGREPGFERMQGRSFVYDGALVALWRTSRGDREGARRILSTLAALQRPDGAWGFSFQVDGDGYYNAGYVRAGAVAWVVYALARYAGEFGDLRYSATLDRGVAWLVAQRDVQTGLIRGGLGRWERPDVFDPTWVARFASTEHQFDAWFALEAARRADPGVATRWQLHRAVQELATAIDAVLWLPQEGRYAQGVNEHGIDAQSALDASGTWAALYEQARGRTERTRATLDWVDVHHRVQVLGWQGMRPYLDAPPDTWFVEASLAVPMVLARMGRPEQARTALQPFAELACAGGVPLVYSPVWATDFPLSPATAPTIWYLFATAEAVRGEPPFLWRERPEHASASRGIP